ncbi:MAG TPA: FtsL-like putative cell division protein [Bacteroidia bacterium]|nr:FtsL-like putative cell division protein [Bacteroidia bacterium]
MTKNAIKEKPQEQEQKPKQKSSGGNIVSRTLGNVLTGAFLSKENTLRALPFIFFLTFIALCYIANGYYAEEQIRKLNKLTNDLKELRSEYIVTKSDLMFISNQSEVARRAIAIGVKESVEPPKKIEVNRQPLAPATE